MDNEHLTPLHDAPDVPRAPRRGVFQHYPGRGRGLLPEDVHTGDAQGHRV